MSLFETVTLQCPSCGEDVDFSAVASVNADRRPDLREAILDGSFQRETCGSCDNTFRLEPTMTYLDQGRGFWIVSHPFSSIGDFESLEEQVQADFELGYGAGATKAAQKIGAGLTRRRLTFGWAGFREKLFAAENELDDVALELTKIAVLRGSDSAPIAAETELRLVEIDDDTLIMAWIDAARETIVEKLGAPKDLYQEIADDQSGWKALREELSGCLFVDMQRLMIESSK